MLARALLIAFGATSDAKQARSFYCGLLGLTAVEETDFALVLDANGTELWLQKVAKMVPPPYTQLGWSATDLAETAALLAKHGIAAERFGFLEQDDLGVWISPGGAHMLWFRDPDGNTLSLTQHPDREHSA